MSPIIFQRELKPRQITFVLVFVNFIWRLAWIGSSQGSYTDGILQINIFNPDLGQTFWPPLYGVLAHLFTWIPGVGLEGSARLISILAGSAAVAPIASIAGHLFGRRAALMAALAYTVSPLPLRWSMQPMTDATFMTLWISSLAALIVSARHAWPELFIRGDEAAAPKDPKAAGQWLLLASMIGALATMTRYQGIFLVPLIGLTAWRSRHEKTPWLGFKISTVWIVALPWLILPMWILRRGVGPFRRHFAQIGDRASSGSAFETFTHYLYLFERFILESPYYLTYGLFGFFLYGLFRTQFGIKRVRLAIWAALYLALMIVGSQSVFQSYQYRYILPLVPLFCIVTGHGLAVWERKCKVRSSRFWALVFPSLGYALMFSTLVAFWQGNPFGDIKQAGRAIRDLPPETRIFSTERYNAEIGAAKLSYWSGGRDIMTFDLFQLRPGDVAVLISYNGDGQSGGWRQYQQLKRAMNEFFTTELIGEVHARNAYPILTDIMEEPRTHQNPLAWFLRYKRQKFETRVLRITGYQSQESPKPSEPEEAGNNP